MSQTRPGTLNTFGIEKSVDGMAERQKIAGSILSKTRPCRVA